MMQNIVRWFLRRVVSRETPDQQVLRQMAAQPDCRHFALDLSYVTGLSVGTVYVALARLERCGKIQAAFEQRGDQRPARRYYRVMP